ncbi:MAG: hypothetical protein IT257_04805 [Chitinophagaceae bacterium]|nr:hypothetical protein [Chitinophagaceae bacterium]
MKHFLSGSIVLLFLITSLQLKAQFTKADIFKSSVDITWLGVDYSEVKFIGPATGWGDEGTKTPTEMRDKYFPAWNELMVKEAKVFKIAEAVSRAEVNFAVDVTADANAKMNKKEIFSENIGDFQLVSEADVQSMIKNYNFKGKTGIGFLLIAEGMSKGREEASYWVTFVDMKSKKVLLTQRMLGKASGIGFRNYWANTVKNILKAMKKDFKNWE